jgi:hypothetical protein
MTDSIQLVNIDFYVRRGRHAKSEPVIRVFGPTQSAFHACLHIHGASWFEMFIWIIVMPLQIYPYIYFRPRDLGDGFFSSLQFVERYIK